MTQPWAFQRRPASVVLLLVLHVINILPPVATQEANETLTNVPVTSCPSCSHPADEQYRDFCFISNCVLDSNSLIARLPLADLRSWLPESVRASTPENSSVILADVTLRVPSCEPIWALQAEACTFRLSTFWPSAGLQTGSGFVFFPLLNNSLSSGVIAHRLNVTCPSEQWPALQAAAPGSLLPCGTATVTSGSDLIAALTDLQPTFLRVFITLAANISLPTSPTPLRGSASPYGNSSAAAADAPTLSLPFFDYWSGSSSNNSSSNGSSYSSDGSSGGSSGNSSNVAGRDDDNDPLVVIYRNTTLVGLGSVASGSPTATELNLRSRRNAFRLQQPRGVSVAVPSPSRTPPPRSSPSHLPTAPTPPPPPDTTTEGTAQEQQQQQQQLGKRMGSSSSGNSSANRVVFVVSDMTLVNVPPGPPSTWPLGLLSADMWHMGLDRSASAPIQLIHLRLSLVLSFGQTKYFNHWYTRLISVVDDEERASAAWMQQLISPTVPVYTEDGATINRGLTRTYIEKYDVSATAMPLLTAPFPMPVDLWVLEDPPPHPDTIGFVSSAEELLADLSHPWTGPRVLVLLADIGLDCNCTWPKDGIQLASSVTLAGPMLAPPPSWSSVPYTQPQFNMYGIPFVRVPWDKRVSFRNLRVLNLSVSVSWALPEAPEALPGVPGYMAWRTRCLPGFLDNVMGRYEMHGCQVDVPPDVFGLLRIFNKPLCAHPDNASSATAKASPSGVDGDVGGRMPSSSPNASSASATVNCTNIIDVTAAGFPYLLPALTTFFDRIFRATGQLTLPNATAFFFAAHTLTGVKLNATFFKVISYPDRGPTEGPPPPDPATAAPSPPHSHCNLQALFGMLLSAPPATAAPPASTSITPAAQERSAPAGAVIGGAVGGALLGAVLAAVLALFVVRQLKLRSKYQRHLREAEARATPKERDSLAGAAGSCSGLTSRFSAAPSGGPGAASAIGGAGGDMDRRREASCLVACGMGMSQLPYGSGGGGGSTAAACGSRAGGGVVQEGQLGVVLAAAPQPRVVGEGDPDDCCSAFSQSFLVADPAHGDRGLTMLDQVLGKQLETLAPPGVHRSRQPPAAFLFAGSGAEAAFVPRLWVDRGAGAESGARRPGSGRGGGVGVGAGGSGNNGHNNAPDMGGGSGGGAAVMGTAGTTGTAISGSGSGAHRTLAGEIDGMIRRYEAKSVSAASGASQGTQRQRVLGSGGFGVVYKGQWRGLPVAIKVVLLQEGDSVMRRERLVREVALSATLSHPNVVATYHYTVQPVAAAAAARPVTGGQSRLSPRPPGDVTAAAATAAAAPSPRLPCLDFHDDHDVRAYKLSIVMAYCDKGTLRDALRTGLFRRPWPPLAAVGGGGGWGWCGGHLSGPLTAAAALGPQTAGKCSGEDGGGSGSCPQGGGTAPVGGGQAAGQEAPPAGQEAPPAGQEAPPAGQEAPPAGQEAAPPGAGLMPRRGCEPGLTPGAAAAGSGGRGGRTLASLQSGPMPYSRWSPLPPHSQAACAAADVANNLVVRPRSARGNTAASKATSGPAGSETTCAAGVAGTMELDAPNLIAAAPTGGDAASPRALRSPPLLALAGSAAAGNGRLTWDDVRPAPNQALALFAALDVARGLEYLHACNVIHGDLSLQNILLTTSEPIFSDAVLAVSACAFVNASNGATGMPQVGPTSAGACSTAAGASGSTSGGAVAPATRWMQSVMHRLPKNPSWSGSAAETPEPRCTAAPLGSVAIVMAESQPAPVVSGSTDGREGTAGAAVLAPATAAQLPVEEEPPPPLQPPPPTTVMALHGALTRPAPVTTAALLDAAAASAPPAAARPAALCAVQPLAAACTIAGAESLGPVTPDSAEAPQASASLWASCIAGGGGGGGTAAAATDVRGTSVAGIMYGDVGSGGGGTAAAAIEFPIPKVSPIDGDGTSGEADASTAAEPLGGIASTATQSETLWGFSLSLGDQTPLASAGCGLGGGRLPSMGRRVAAVQPLLSQVFKISDFGLSVRLEGDETHRSGLHQGTPYYTATEVLVSGKVSPAADIYSYGVCLWCLMHGVSLCQLRHLLPPIFTPVAPALLARISPDLPAAVRSLLRRCLAGDPGRRPSAVALVQELQVLVQAAVGPELALLLLGAERRERDVGRTVAGLLLSTIDSATGKLAAMEAAPGAPA